jgi:hypothetical protein
LTGKLWSACKTKPDATLRDFLNGSSFGLGNVEDVRSTKNNAALPIGKTAKMAYELDSLRTGCSRAAAALVKQSDFDEAELDECARLDDALALAQRILKAAVRNVMLSRLSRNSRSAQ